MKPEPTRMGDTGCRVRCHGGSEVCIDELKPPATLSGRFATIGVLALLTAGCGASRPTLTKGTESPAASGSTTAVTVPVSAARLIATARSGHVDIYDAPSSSTPRVVLPNPWALNGGTADLIPQVFRVIRRRTDGWVQVQLPLRPNGQSGWIPRDEVDITQTPYRIEVALSAHQITVFDESTVLYRGPVATGAASTPTPTGSYYLRVLLESSNATSAYGPFAFGLSAHSDALTTFNGSDAEIGLHGNNDASALGRSVSHGCIRMENTAITRLSKILPLGTAVDIVR